MLIFTGVLILALMLAFNLPVMYAGARLSAEQSCADTQGYPVAARTRPLLAALLLCGGVLPAWIITGSPLFALFVLLLASAAYIDCLTQWVPDVLIFALSWVALWAQLTGNPDPVIPLSGAVVMLAPALILNVITWLRRQPSAIASGDLYVLPAVGVWLPPEWSGICLLLSLGLTALAGRYVEDVPFITVLYPVFMGVSLCGAW